MIDGDAVWTKMVVEQTYAVAAVPENFDPVSATSSENIQMT
jgi:hypothetical protein